MPGGPAPRARVRSLYTLLALPLLGCNDSVRALPSEVASARFGLFFGGQVQERLELTKPLSQDQSSQGLRLEFRHPLPNPEVITWYLDLPTVRTGPRGPGSAARTVRSSNVNVRAGSERFELPLPIEPADPPGTYDFRVLLGNDLVLDRCFRLVAPHLEDND